MVSPCISIYLFLVAAFWLGGLGGLLKDDHKKPLLVMLGLILDFAVLSSSLVPGAQNLRGGRFLLEL